LTSIDSKYTNIKYPINNPSEVPIPNPKKLAIVLKIPISTSISMAMGYY